MERAGISEGAVFRRLVGQTGTGGALFWERCADLHAVGQSIEMPEKTVNQVRRHSTRVGATQDLAALDVDSAAITQASGWKSTRMPLQYAEKADAARSGIARAAAVSSRDEPILK